MLNVRELFCFVLFFTNERKHRNKSLRRYRILTYCVGIWSFSHSFQFSKQKWKHVLVWMSCLRSLIRNIIFHYLASSQRDIYFRCTLILGTQFSQMRALGANLLTSVKLFNLFIDYVKQWISHWKLYWLNEQLFLERESKVNWNRQCLFILYLHIYERLW